MNKLRHHLRRLILESLGWLLVVAGIAALLLPGPGLLMVFAGLALLATQYQWAERRLEPVRRVALQAARDGVKTWRRIALSICSALSLMLLGLLWGLRPAPPHWWHLADKWWLVGGWGTGATLIGSGVVALTIITYSFIKFRTHEPKH